MEFLSFILIFGGMMLFVYLCYANIVMGVDAQADYEHGRKYKNTHRFPNAIIYHAWWKFFAFWGKYKRNPEDIAARNARLFKMEGK